MLRIVTGGSGSGKSAFAEDLILSFGEKKRYYIATMRPWDEECRKRISRHREMRRGKGFETIEQYVDVDMLDPGPGSAVLLECLSNLTANEYFREDRPAEGREGTEDSRQRETERRLTDSLLCLAGRTDELVIVTNEVFSDGCSYDRETERYLELLGRVNRCLAAAAGEVTEVVYGIPVVLKAVPEGKEENRA